MVTFELATNYLLSVTQSPSSKMELPSGYSQIKTKTDFKFSKGRYLVSPSATRAAEAGKTLKENKPRVSPEISK